MRGARRVVQSTGGAQKAREEEDVIERADGLRWPIALKDDRLEDYGAVYYYPGGHGPMEDLAFDAGSGKLLVRALASGKPLATRDADGRSPFADYRITGYTNDEEEPVGLASRARWLLEDEVKKLGVEFSRGPIWQPCTVVDRNLYTGQDPASAGPLGPGTLESPQVITATPSLTRHREEGGVPATPSV